MSPPTRPTFQPQRQSGGARLFSHFKTIALIGTSLFIGYWLWSGGKPNPFAQAPPQPFTPESAQNVELATVASVQRQQLIAAKLKQRQAMAASDELTRDLGEWEKEMTAWESEGSKLLRSDEGKRLAADTTVVRQLRAVFKEERPGVEAVRAARKQAEELVFPIRESLKNAEDASAPSDFAVTTFRELQSQARNARERYREAREAASVLLAQAPAATGSKTFEQAIASVDKEEILKRVATLEAAEKKARDEATQLVANAKAALIQTEGEAEAQRLRDDAAKKKQASDQATAKTVEEMEVKQKESERELARLRDLAELKRQGAIIGGTTWKGTHYERSTLYNMTLVVVSRSKDEIRVELRITEAQSGVGGGSYSFQGTIKGNSIRFRKPGENTEVEIDATYNPSSQTISGKWSENPFNLKLHQAE